MSEIPVLTDELPETSQNNRVLQYLASGRPLDARLAARFMGIYRLAARVYDLRRNGHRIESSTIYRGNKHFSVYKLVRE